MSVINEAAHRNRLGHGVGRRSDNGDLQPQYAGTRIDCHGIDLLPSGLINRSPCRVLLPTGIGWPTTLCMVTAVLRERIAQS